MEIRKSIGVDVGGSHVSSSIIDPCNSSAQVVERNSINAFENAYSILKTIGHVISQTAIEEESIDAVGIAFPGPFDYEKGISQIAFVGGKFESTFGIHVQQALQTLTGLSN